MSKQPKNQDVQMNSDNEEEQEIEDLSNPFVVNAYQAASTIANKALKEVIAQCVQGKVIVEICTFGDNLIEGEVAKVYNKRKDIVKGIGFPTCISVNNCVGHFSPLKTDKKTLSNGDVVKIDLGVQIDGYCAVGAHTIIIGQVATVPTTGKVADAICAAHYAIEGAIRLVRPGLKSTQVTEAIEKVCDIYKVNSVNGILSHDIQRYSIEGEKVIFPKTDASQKQQVFDFEVNEVYCIDIAITTGDGKPKEMEDRCTVFQRVVDQNYYLKNDSSRRLINEVNKRFTAFPFTLRAFADVTKAKLGLSECLQHNLLSSFPVYYDKPGTTVVQFKTTLLVLPSGNVRLIGNDLQLPFVKSEYAITDQKILDFLAVPLRPTKTTTTTTPAKMDTN